MKIGEWEIKIGADPELFVSNGKEFVSAHGMVAGTKEEPYPVKNGAVQVDGMALEFNIDPANNPKEFVDNLTSVMEQLKAMVPDYEVHTVPVAHFSEEEIGNAPAEALELGCQPDYNAWDGGAANPVPDGKVNFRTAAGHIHIGWTEGMDIDDAGHRQACILLAKQLDFHLGLPSVLFDRDEKRRQLYGKAGAFRVKPYGMEYRVLSNAWLKDKSLMLWVYNNTITAFRRLIEGNLDARANTSRIINDSDVDNAKYYIENNNYLNPPPKKFLKGV